MYPAPIAPYIKSSIAEFCSINGAIIPLSLLNETSGYRGYPITELETHTFGYRIPYLPNFIVSPHFAGSNEKEKITEVLNRQSQIVANLIKWKNVSFALRYLIQPASGEVSIQILVKIMRNVGAGKDLARLVAQDLDSTFRSLEIPLEPIFEPDQLELCLSPFPDMFVLQIAQREELIPIRVTKNSAYVVYPFRQPSSTWVQTLELVLRQTSPALISIQLEPTQLLTNEKVLFSDIAAKAANWADYPVFTINGQVYMSDPLAKVVARLHEDYIRRFSSPSLLAIYVGSPNQATAYATAQAIGADITERIDLERALQSDYDFPSGFEIFAPTSTFEDKRAINDINNLTISPFGKNISPERHITAIPASKERLRFLTDVKSASSAFRFPIGVRGGIPGIKTIQRTPSYDVGPRTSIVNNDEIHIGRYSDRGGMVSLPIKNFARHTLVAGTTGSGKTTTCFQMLAELWDRGIPFLVIEPANTIYRSLLHSPLGKRLRIYTLGDETVSPFRLNPLELMPGISVEKHSSILKSCLEASLPNFGILPSILSESIELVYSDRGWQLTDKAKIENTELFPVLGDLYHAVIKATESRQYSDKTLQDIRAAAAGRIGSLLRGSRGRMLNTSKSISFDELMKYPTVLELESLESDDDKALVMLFLITMIREYCRVNYRKEEGLHHVTLIEEAHRVLRATTHVSDREVSSDTRATAVEMFNSALSELRTYGEGLIIAEQSPHLLTVNALANTNTKIIHKLPASEDRSVVAKTINASPEQETFLTKLEPGSAAFFMQGLEQATFITVEDYRNKNNLPNQVDDSDITDHMNLNNMNDSILPFPGCVHCRKPCLYRDRIDRVAYDIDSGKSFQMGLFSFERDFQDQKLEQAWRNIIDSCKKILSTIGLADDPHAVFCYFLHFWNYPVTENTAKKIFDMI